MQELYSWEQDSIADVRKWLDRARTFTGNDLEYARFTGAMQGVLPSVLRTIERLTKQETEQAA